MWAAACDLTSSILANGVHPTLNFGVTWDVGKTVYEIFKTEDPNDPAIAAHLAALEGTENETRLQGEFANMLLRVVPLRDETGDEVLGCISILNQLRQ